MKVKTFWELDLTKYWRMPRGVLDKVCAHPKSPPFEPLNKIYPLTNFEPLKRKQIDPTQKKYFV
jgi:hypothetical protein